MLHTLRFLEFGYVQDFHVIKITYCKLRPKLNDYLYNANYELDKKKLFSQSSEFLDSLSKCVDNKHIQKEIFSNQPKSKNKSNIQNPTAQEILKQDMNWQNSIYPVLNCTIAGGFKSYPPLVKTLIDKLQEFFNQNPAVEKPQNWNKLSIESCCSKLRKYLGQLSNNKMALKPAFFGWSLAEFNEQCEQRKEEVFISKSKTISKETLELISNENNKWINDKYGLVLPCKFEVFDFLVEALVNPLPLEDRPPNWTIERSGIARVNIRKVFYKVLKQKRKRAYGWRFIMDVSATNRQNKLSENTGS